MGTGPNRFHNLFSAEELVYTPQESTTQTMTTTPALASKVDNSVLNDMLGQPALTYTTNLHTNLPPHS
jgi:hypothetical protein